MEYTFTLRYQLSEADGDAENIVERLGAAGCDDALVGTGLPGRVALQFQREAASADAAVTSALRDVRSAIPTARLTEVTPDLAGLTDIAELVGMSRQNMRKLMLSHGASFPAPVHEGNPSLWHLVEVLAWLRKQGSYAVPGNLLEIARVAMQLNVARDHGRVGRPLPADLQRLAG
ncbi:helix-turn-helix transcriptional regulator [Paracidovorax citrulli]